jgi:hypothetical protein
MRELEHQHSNLLADDFTRFEKSCREQVSVQEILIRLAGLRTETVELRKSLDGERIGHLEAEPEIVWHLICQPLQILATREVVIGGIEQTVLNTSAYSSDLNKPSKTSIPIAKEDDVPMNTHFSGKFRRLRFIRSRSKGIRG